MHYSRQRELILQAVLQNSIHPTAETVYTLVRALEPNISLGTVYRNLNLLAAQGRLRKISIPGASDRYDGNLVEHHHLLCASCGSLSDLFIGNLVELEQVIKRIPEVEITGCQILFTGLCPNCNNRQKYECKGA